MQHKKDSRMISALSLYQEAQQYFPGGVNASARANPALGHPFFIQRGEGPYVFDLEGRQYIDMCMSHGASLLGHDHPKIKAAVIQALEAGIICSYETEHHVRLGQKLTEMVPCAEMARFAGSGTETIMHALRLARATTGREKIIKFEGHFHGYSDDIFYSSGPPLEEAGPASSPTPFPQSAGIPRGNSDRVVIVPFNNTDALTSAFEMHGRESAALILEPVNYDAGCITPQPGFLELCRRLCDQYGVLLFFDEVLTAFRFSAGCAQEYYGVTPDLAVLGKAFGGGMPISAIVGKREVMENLRPVGSSEHSGTYLAHLTAVLAAEAAIDEFGKSGFYEYMEELSSLFYKGFEDRIEKTGVQMRIQYVGPRFGLFFGITDKVTNYRQAAMQNHKMALSFYKACIDHDVYFHVSPHHGFSSAHTKADLRQALDGIEKALQQVRMEFH
jgi:glutamate-1-semialdehyde 2,1-aminomutase